MTRALGLTLGLALVACGVPSGTDGGVGGAGGQAGAGGAAGAGGGTAGAGGGAAGTGGTVDAGPAVPGDGGVLTFGAVHAGSYHVGPVDFAQTVWTNACAPYPAAVQSLAGVYLAGVDNSLAADGSLCDACALVTTRLGRQVLVRIITYGVSNAPGDMDLSPEAYAAIHQVDPQGTTSNPRPMTWQLARCRDAGPLVLQYQTQANPFWTSLWVRNARLPVERVEVRSSRHATFTALRRGTDGTFTDDSGFGDGAFTLRITGRGVTVQQDFTGFTGGQLVTSTMRLE